MRTAGGCLRLLESSGTVLYRPVRSIQVRKRQISFKPPLILLFLAQLTDTLPRISSPTQIQRLHTARIPSSPPPPVASVSVSSSSAPSAMDFMSSGSIHDSSTVACREMVRHPVSGNEDTRCRSVRDEMLSVRVVVWSKSRTRKSKHE